MLLLGRRALAETGPQVFTIAVISDSQNYCDGRYQPASSSRAWQNGNYNLPYFLAQMNYLKDKASELNLAFATHVGDVVQNGDGSTLFMPGNPYNGATVQHIEWVYAQEAIDILAEIGVPFGLSPGNHDYDNQTYRDAGNKYPPLVSTVPYWKDIFGSGSKYFAGKPWYIGASDEVGYISTGEGGTERECGHQRARPANMGCPAPSYLRQAVSSSCTSVWRWKRAAWRASGHRRSSMPTLATRPS